MHMQMVLRHLSFVCTTKSIQRSDTNLDECEILWTNTVKYLGVYPVSSKTFRCAIDNAKKSLYRSFNCIFGKVGRLASEHVMVKLLKTKCLLLLLYGMEVCSPTKAQIRSMDYAISSYYRDILNVISDEKCTALYGHV